MKKIVSVILAVIMVICTATVYADIPEQGIPGEVSFSGEETSSEEEVSIKIGQIEIMPSEYHVVVRWTTSDGEYSLNKEAVAWDADALKYVLVDTTKCTFTAPTASVLIINASTPGNDITVVPGLSGENGWVINENQSIVKTIKIGETDLLTSGVIPQYVSAVTTAGTEAQDSSGVASDDSNKKSFTYVFDFDNDLLAQKALALSIAGEEQLELTNTFVVTIGVPS